MSASVSAARSSMEHAAAALDLVGRDPRLALTEADAAAAEALAAGDPTALCTAHRAAGLALRGLGDLPGAEARLRTGIRAATRAGAEQAAAEARMSLAFILLDRGRLRTALTEADRAAGRLTGLPAARLASQRALILQRTGRLDEALAAYAATLPHLRRAGDLLWQARLHNNRGLLHAHRGAPAAAEADFIRARSLWHALSMDVHAAESECNLANVAALSGDAPAALAGYDRAERSPALRTRPIPQLQLNRCQVLLSVGLFEDARRTAQRAVAELREADAAADLAEAQLWLAETAAALGLREVAAREAREALDLFTRQGRPGWASLARLVALRAVGEHDLAPRALVRSALECAEALAAAGWRVAELDARLIAAGAAVRAGDLATAERVLGPATGSRPTRPVRSSGTLETRVRAWHAQALLRQARGDRRGALAALRAGLALVGRYQAALGATELRVHVSAFGAEPAALGLDLALAAGDARMVLGWAERARARALRLRPVKPPHDPELAEALVELRRLAAQDTAARRSGSSAPADAVRRAAEDRVVRASRVAGSPLHRPEDAPPNAAALVAALGDAALVEFVRRGGELLAVTLSAGRCRLRPVAELAEVTAALDAAVAGLNALAMAFGTPRGRAAVRASAQAAGRRLDDLLLGPVRAELGDRPLVVVPTSGLHGVPWGLLPSLTGRPVRVAPSAAAWLRAVRSPVRRGGRVLLAAGPGLPAARSEVAALARRAPAAEVLLDDRATVPAVLAAVDGADLAHVAAHGRLRTDNPLLSALELADGPLTVYDLERLSRAPEVVVLPACQSGVAAVRAGDEVIGLVSALLALGARTVVATAVPVSDVDTEPVMLALHERLLAGVPPAEAMAATRAAIAPTDDGAVAAAAGFVTFGA
ncbi:CHAT domain-containing tetratricopeptide repeat protein [Saccharothrix sp. S26]|uniref:CHAT domain-containing protein n=1 Tax=Saccharothrix sp. S26 TaxID=2907215 RepID=UPI001F2B8DE3|nr:CHAT domain-containing tetratricopeptide repeat protein [Saccharothrix sp. S26]MCE6998448.1 CHAT domain-containing tetratricopeptide repeat protein [Saccharothrix sp. S26]